MILFSLEKLGVVQSICFPSTLKTIKLAIDWTINWTIDWTIDWTVNNDQALTDQRNHQLALAWHLSLVKSTLPLIVSLFCPICPNLSYLPRFLHAHGWYVDGVDLCNHPKLLDDAGAVLEVLTFLGKSSSEEIIKLFLVYLKSLPWTSLRELFPFPPWWNTIILCIIQIGRKGSLCCQ